MTLGAEQKEVYKLPLGSIDIPSEFLIPEDVGRAQAVQVATIEDKQVEVLSKEQSVTVSKKCRCGHPEFSHETEGEKICRMIGCYCWSFVPVSKVVP